MKQTFTRVRSLAAAVLLLLIFGSVAQAALPEKGKVYQLINANYGTALVGNGPASSVTCAASDAAQLSQLWLLTQGASSGTYYLRNLNTGMYLTSSRMMSTPWSVSTTPVAASDLSITESGANLIIKAAADTYSFMYLHCDGSQVAVCWTTDTNSSMWSVKASSLSQAEIDAAFAAAEANLKVTENADAIQAALIAMFSDKACTQLKSNYASMTDTQLAADSNYKTLPAELQAMVKKVKSGNWAETDIKTGKGWDSDHARKFRVQSYEPYSRGAEVTGLTGVQAYTNMNNPTGINTVAHKALYVMVDKAPAAGSTLYLNGAVGGAMYNDWNAGIALHEGLNIIPVWDNDAIQYVYYTVDTWSNNKRNKKLTDFSDITIHIEGGSLNGFFNHIGDKLYTPDTQADWLYYRERASHMMFDLVGQYVILHFFFDKMEPKAGCGYTADGLKQILDPTVNSFDLTKIMTAWDDMCFAERLLCGFQSNDDINSERAKGYFAPHADSDVAPNDIHEYFNNRMMGITLQGDLYMNATTWRTAYNASTMPDILLRLPSNAGCIWGPAHEYGHMNQTPMKIAGTTEISNNVFSNVAVWYQGIATSRSDYPSAQRTVFNAGKTYLEHGTWGTTRMFWQLWLYYHVIGHNRKFYPTLYQLLRNEPLQKNYNLNSRYDLLHFAKMCCKAAGEDLTEFFEAWGFFVPQKDYFIDDYSQWISNLSQADIDAVKAEIKAFNYPKNHSLLLIDDRPGSTRQSYSEWDKGGAGVLGGIADFQAGTTPDGKHLFALAGTGVKVSGGKGGVGFIGLEDNGTIITFANDYAWDMNAENAYKLASGKAKLYAVAADGKLTEVPNAIYAGTAAQKAEVIKSLLDATNEILAFTDETLTRVGWYRADKMQNLSKAYDEASAVAASDPVKAYELLAAEYYKVMLDKFTRITVRPGNIYRFANRNYGKALTAGVSAAVSRDISVSSDIQKWQLIDAGDSQYYVYNPKQDKYLGQVSRSVVVPETASPEVKYSLIEVEPGYFSLACEGDESLSLHIDAAGSVVGWYSSNNASQWHVVLVEASDVNKAADRLEELVVKTEDLLDRAGTIDVTVEPVKLTASMMYSNAKCRTNTYGDQFVSWAYLWDGNTTTFFHSDYSTYKPVDDLDHYLQVDLGEGNETDGITFTYTTRGSGTLHAPSSMTVYGSNDAENWTVVTSINSGLPSAAATAYESDVISCDKAYRHFRFMVNTTYSGATNDYGHQYFVMSEFGVSKANVSAIPAAAYPEVKAHHLLNAHSYKTAARAVLGNAAATVEHVNAAHDGLLPHYEALKEAMDKSASIADVVSDLPAEAPAVIFDLQGRRIKSVTTPGLYIINGRKTLIR